MCFPSIKTKIWEKQLWFLLSKWPQWSKHSFLTCAKTSHLVGFLSFFFSWPHHTAYGIVVPWPGIEPTPPAVEAWSLNQWAAREAPWLDFLIERQVSSHLTPLIGVTGCWGWLSAEAIEMQNPLNSDRRMPSSAFANAEHSFRCRLFHF